MALNKLHQIRFDGLQQTFTMLQTNGIPLPQIKSMMQSQMDDFRNITNHKITFAQNGDSVELGLLNLAKDFVRVRGTDEFKVLRTKINGVPVDVKISKVDDFLFSNEDISAALRALADEVDALPFQANTLSIEADVRKMLNQGEPGDEQIGEEDDSELEDLSSDVE